MGPVMPPVKNSTLTTFPLGHHLVPGSQPSPRAARLSLGANFGVFCLNATAAAATVPRPLNRRRPSQQHHHHHHQQPAGTRKRWAIDGDDLTSLQWLHEDPCLLHGLGLGAQSRADPGLADGKPGAGGKVAAGGGDGFEGEGAPPPPPLPPRADKPPYSFSCLIFLAMEEAPGKRLPVHGIYEWIAARFPYFARAPDGWKNSIRHDLSLNKCFRKADRSQHSGKGSLWAVQPEYRPVLLDALRRTGHRSRSPTDKLSPPSLLPLSPRRPRHGWSAFALHSPSSLMRGHRGLSGFHAAAADRRSTIVKSLHGTGPWRGSTLDCADTVKPCPRTRGPWARPGTGVAPALQLFDVGGTFPLTGSGAAESEGRSEARARLACGADAGLYLKRGQVPGAARRNAPAGAGDDGQVGEARGGGGASASGTGGAADGDAKPAATTGGSAGTVAAAAASTAAKPAAASTGDDDVDGGEVDARAPSAGVGTVPGRGATNPAGGDHGAGLDVADGRSAGAVRRSGAGNRRPACADALADHNYGLPRLPPPPPPPPMPARPSAAAPTGHAHRQPRHEKPSGRRWKRAWREAVNRGGGGDGREDGEVEREDAGSSSSSQCGRNRKRRRGDEQRDEQQLSWEARVAGVDDDVREAVTSLLFLAGVDAGPLWRPPGAVPMEAVAVGRAPRRGTAQPS